MFTKPTDPSSRTQDSRNKAKAVWWPYAHTSFSLPLAAFHQTPTSLYDSSSIFSQNRTFYPSWDIIIAKLLHKHRYRHCHQLYRSKLSPLETSPTESLLSETKQLSGTSLRRKAVLLEATASLASSRTPYYWRHLSCYARPYLQARAGMSIFLSPPLPYPLANLH